MGGWDSWKEVTGTKATTKPMEDIELDPAQEILRKFMQGCLYNKNFEWLQMEFRMLMWTAFDMGREYEKAKGKEDGKQTV